MKTQSRAFQGANVAAQFRRRLLLIVPLLLLLLIPALGENNANATTVGGSGQIRYGLEQKKGFDTCSAPTISQMQTWWTSSPYYDIGIYIGGSTRACGQPNLTSSWVTSAHNQGWSFYLIWAGPQAPCNGGSISTNTGTAFNQGKQEGLNAINAGLNLGFTGYNAFYYDMENYDETNVTCRNAVNSFVSGWVYQLRVAFPEKAGVYGNGCDASYWASIQFVPDFVWIADASGDPDVWGLNCLANGLWSGTQRIHQYVINSVETYGSVQLQIDRDCADSSITPHGHSGEDTTCTVE